MKLEFKFGSIGITSFFILSGLFYWLCPLPSSLVGKILLCTLAEIIFFAMSFVVVSHKSIIRRK